MIESSNCHVEVAGRIATLYVVGKIPLAASHLIPLCTELPPSVEVLSVNLDGAEALLASDLAIIDQVRAHWEATRRGVFRVAFTLASPRPTRTYKVRMGA